MNAIFKYPIPGSGTSLFCGELLHFGEQHGEFFVWAKTEPAVQHIVHLITTGAEFDDTGLRHIGSVITDGGHFVVHAFSS
jgi:hypothetical protein